jgi:hypothetical protein
MRSIEQLTEEILSLPSGSRAMLADKLIESLEFDTDSAIQTVWMKVEEMGFGMVQCEQFQGKKHWRKLDD